MANNKKQKLALAKTLYGIEDINKLSSRQLALIKAYIRDISNKQTERKGSRQI
tara:strand:+ start:36 stop:194 length:159 start_codon:yes stop_codon:yes gene_type:complete